MGDKMRLRLVVWQAPYSRPYCQAPLARASGEGHRPMRTIAGSGLE